MTLTSSVQLLILLLLLSAFASSSETALFSLDRFQMRRLRERARPSYDKIRTLLSHPTRLLIIILIFTEAVNLSLSNLFTKWIHGAIPPTWIGDPRNYDFVLALLSTLVAAPLVLIFGEITPKVLAAKMNRVVAAWNVRLLIVIYRALLPILIPLDYIITWFLKRFKGSGKDHLSKFLDVLDEEDIVALVDEAHKEGTLEPSERKLIQRVLCLDDIYSSQIMTPLNQTFMLSETLQISDALKEIRTQKYSRIPVYGKNRRHVTGVLYVKDLLPLREKGEKHEHYVSELTDRPMFVSSQIKLSALLKKFKKTQIHMAIVTDQNQNAVGVVTLEDVLESIFGEIEDERDLP